jgi:hypothetical protein
MKNMFILLLLYTTTAVAQDAPAPSVPTEYAFTIEAAISGALEMGESTDGTRRSIPITGGSFAGAGIKGEVLPGGADYQLTRTDGTTYIRAIYMIRTDDGALINVVNEGYIVPPGARGNDVLYFRTTPHFTAPNGPYGWLNSTVFVSAIRFSPAKPGVVIIDVYKVL